MHHLLFFFSTRTGLASHCGKNTSIMKPAARSRAISSPTVLLFSSDSRRRGCLTGFASARTCSLCSAKSFGTAGVSFGDHAKMSRFSRMNSMSALSYFRSKLALMLNCLDESPGMKSTSLVSAADLNFRAGSCSVWTAGLCQVHGSAVLHVFAAQDAGSQGHHYSPWESEDRLGM